MHALLDGKEKMIAVDTIFFQSLDTFSTGLAKNLKVLGGLEPPISCLLDRRFNR